MVNWDVNLEPPEVLEPPEWALDEIDALEERNEYINNQLRDYEAMVDWYYSLDKTELAEWYCELIEDLEEERYDNQQRILDLEDPKSDVYVSYPEGD